MNITVEKEASNNYHIKSEDFDLDCSLDGKTLSCSIETATLDFEKK